MNKEKPDIQYFVHPKLFGEYYRIIYQQLLPLKGVSRVCELGAGGNPSLSQSIIKEQNLDYWVTDVSETGLANCAESYQVHLLDAQQQEISKTLGKFDLIFSKMLVEHLPNPLFLHRNIFDALNPNGYAFHFFPTLGSLTLWLNHLLPDSLMRPLLLWAEPSRQSEQYGKFEAHYQWCEGPTKRNIARFEQIGYEVVLYYGGYGHKYYEKIAPLHWLEHQKSRFLERINVSQLTANACLLLKKN